MGLTIYREQDADIGVLSNARVAVIGYGNQGRAHALNLRDSGLDVIVGQREGARPESDRACVVDARRREEGVAGDEVRFSRRSLTIEEALRPEVLLA